MPKGDAQRAKTHCPHGHEYTPENTAFGKSHGCRTRKCRECARRRERKPPRGAEYTYPLRPDFLARLILPTDLTADEAQRLRAFLLSLAQPERDTRCGLTV